MAQSFERMHRSNLVMIVTMRLARRLDRAPPLRAWPPVRFVVGVLLVALGLKLRRWARGGRPGGGFHELAHGASHQ